MKGAMPRIPGVQRLQQATPQEGTDRRSKISILFLVIPDLIPESEVSKKTAFRPPPKWQAR
jgi:hypothetical protein